MSPARYVFAQGTLMICLVVSAHGLFCIDTSPDLTLDDCADLSVAVVEFTPRTQLCRKTLVDHGGDSIDRTEKYLYGNQKPAEWLEGLVEKEWSQARIDGRKEAQSSEFYENSPDSRTSSKALSLLQTRQNAVTSNLRTLLGSFGNQVAETMSKLQLVNERVSHMRDNLEILHGSLFQLGQINKVYEVLIGKMPDMTTCYSSLVHAYFRYGPCDYGACEGIYESRSEETIEKCEKLTDEVQEDILRHNKCSEDASQSSFTRPAAKSTRSVDLSKSAVPHWPSMTESALRKLCFDFHGSIIKQDARYDAQDCPPRSEFETCDAKNLPDLSENVLAECQAFLNLAEQLELYMFMELIQSRLSEVQTLLDVVEGTTADISQGIVACGEDLADITTAFEKNAETLYKVYKCSSLVADELLLSGSVTTTVPLLALMAVFIPYVFSYW